MALAQPKPEDDGSATTPKAPLTAPLKQRLLATLERARKAPFYEALFGERKSTALVDQYEQIPFTRKHDLIAQSPDGFRALPLEDVFHYHESFGTTDDPLSSWFTVRDLDYIPGIAGRFAEMFGPGRVVLNRFPYSFPVPAALVEHLARTKGGVIIPAGNLNWNVSYTRTLELIQKMKPQIICSLPLEPQILWEIAPRAGFSREIFRSITDLGMSGAVVGPKRTAYLEGLWGARVRNIYGSTEASGMASSCEKGHLHLHSDAFYFELVDREAPHTPIPLEAGEGPGVLVVTTLDREAMPLIRYFTRDVVRVIPTTCGCAEPAIEILGRLDDTLTFEGKLLYPLDLDEAIFSTTLEYFNSPTFFVVVTDKGFHIRVECERTPTDMETPRRQIENALGVPITLETVAVDTLLHRPSIMKTPKVFKPTVYSDWRQPGRKVSAITDALIEWPRYSKRDLLGLVGRAFDRWKFKRRIEF